MLFAAAPAVQLIAKRAKCCGTCLAENADAHDADTHFARHWFRQECPLARALLRLKLRHSADMVQRLEDHILHHPRRQVRVDVTHNRNTRQVRICKQVVDASADGDDQF